jgi:hypothetical protein
MLVIYLVKGKILTVQQRQSLTIERNKQMATSLLIQNDDKGLS